MVKGAEHSIRIDHRRSSKMLGGACAGALQKGAYVEVERELRYREFTPAESNRSVRLAETYVTSILALDRSEKQPTPEAVESELGDEPAD
jgi:single-strand DNA-binding protein